MFRERIASITAVELKGRRRAAGSALALERVTLAETESSDLRTYKGVTLLATGQIAKVEIATLKRQSTSELTLPRSASAPRPKKIRPSAEARLKPARSRDEVEVERPMEVPKRGRKNGGLDEERVSILRAKGREKDQHKEGEEGHGSAAEKKDEAEILEERPVVR